MPARATHTPICSRGRYSHGLRNVIVGTEFVPFDAKTRTFTVLAGFRF